VNGQVESLHCLFFFRAAQLAEALNGRNYRNVSGKLRIGRPVAGDLNRVEPARRPFVPPKEM
jgi:hypothetical protein